MGGPQLGNTMDNSQENNSSDLLRRQLQQPGQIRPPMSNTSLANQNNQMQGQQQLPNPQLVNDPNMVGGQSQLENLLKKSTHDIDPSELAKAHEMRTKVPSVNSLSSGGPGAAQAGAVMTQAATQQQMMTSVASNNQNNISQTNGPEPTIKMEPDSKHGISDLEVKTEFKTEVEPKQEPMDSAPNNSSSSQAVKMEVDVKPKIKEEPNTTATKVEKEEDKAPPIKAEPVVKVTFSRDELRNALLPPLEKMYAFDPEAVPFRTPVDANALGIPDYYDIIKTPMDMSSIRRKLETGGYNDPWEFINDIFLMFENAWVYNRKTSRVYRYCTKVEIITPFYGFFFNIFRIFCIWKWWLKSTQ